MNIPLLNEYWVKAEIKKEVKDFLEFNEMKMKAQHTQTYGA